MADRSTLLEDGFDEVDESFFGEGNSTAEERDANGNAADREYLTRDFSFAQIGSIAQYVKPVNAFNSIEYVLSIFAKNPDIKAVPVEEYDSVVGYIDRESIERAGKNFFRRLGLNRTVKYVKRVPLFLYAVEYCEQCLAKAFAAAKESGVSFFPVFHHRKAFYGLVSMQDLIDRISKVREQDLQRAKAIQDEMMPDAASLKKLPFSVCAWNRMAKPIGGDMYTIYRITDTKYIAACFDVSGKSIAGALVTVALSSFFSALRRFPQVVASPEKIIAELDRFIEDIVPLEIFVTAGIFYVDMDARRLSVFNCGHTTIYFFVPGSVAEGRQTIRLSEVEAFLPPLGMGAVAETIEAGTVKIPSCTIERGLKVELYSDGLLDMQTREGIRYGNDRAKNLFKSLYSASRHDLSRKIELAVEEWTEDWMDNAGLPDDITVVDILF